MKSTLQHVLLSLGLSLILFISGCTSSSTPAPTEMLQQSTPASQPTLATDAPPAQQINNDPQTVAEVEKLVGFDVREPAYLPNGVSFDFATYQASPTPAATLHFKIVHEIYGDMGSFFQILQESQTVAPPDTTSCGVAVEGCEILSIGDMQVVYRLNTGGTEGLNWYMDGFAFRLLRTAGEPNKVYKDELVRVVTSMK